MSTQQGYSASFLTEIPEDLTCVICSLVLRDPIQVVDCGHRFCSPCFNNMLEYSKDQLLCPIDRQPVQRDRVFSDKGMTRMINNLKVKCKNDKQGCEWTGHLGDLDTHDTSCQYKVVAPQIDQYVALNDLCKQLVQRVQRCEEKSDMKEKELAHLRFTIKEMKENINRDEELKTLKEEVLYLKLTAKDMRDEAYKSKEQLITLTDSTSELKNKIEILKKENEEIAHKCTNELKQLQEKNVYLENQMENFKRESCDRDSIEAANADTKQQFSSLNEKLKSNEISRVKVIGDIKNLNTQLDNIQKEVSSARSHLDRSLNKSKNVVSEKTTEIKNLEDHVRSEVGDLQNHVKCIESILFLFNSVEKKELELKWIMENFKENERIGKPVLSPVFHTPVVGYCLQIFITWFGTQKEDIGVHMRLHRRKSENGANVELQPFGHEFTLEVLNRTGGSAKRRVTFNDIQDKHNINNCLTIPPGVDKAKEGLGFSDIIKRPFDNFVIDDAIYVKCTLHL